MAADALDDEESKDSKGDSPLSSVDGPDKLDGEREGDSNSGTDDDGGEDNVPATQGRKISERQQLQRAQFKSWFDRRVENISKEDDRKLQKQADLEFQSKSVLIAEQESNVIIGDPREYQLELFERARAKNTIAVLDTGSGKTLIAVLLLRHILDEELEHRGTGKPPRVSFFLVDSVTLVFQQYAVLECNLDQKIERFCGDMGCDLWSHEIWRTHFQENMVIVCTADVLYQCLMHSFVSMSQINLLIFDEAHHAKKNHPYARIMKDFYLAERDPTTRPRVFGMTASPVDAKVDVVKAAKQLETLLHCQIATTSDLNMLRRSVHRPLEETLMHEKLISPAETHLFQQLRAPFGDLDILSKQFRNSKEASIQLGPWCSDQLWASLVREDEGQRAASQLERDLVSKNRDTLPAEESEAQVARLRQAVAIVKGHAFEEPRVEAAHLSSKVRLLHAVLGEIFAFPAEAKCIVFVRKRYTARLLGELLGRVGTPFMHVGVLLGARKGDVGDLNVTYRQQLLTLLNFRRGKLNCLFSTSVAEEGLDIPDCNIVIRFDLYATLIQYVQSRGRARRINSRYIHIVEQGNNEQLALLRDVRAGEHIMRDFCESLPSDRLLLGNDCDLDGLITAERSQKSYTEDSTGAKLTYNSSLAVLAHFVDCLPRDVEAAAKANYVMTCQGRQYVCEVILPDNSPLRSVIGAPASRKAIAKRSAAFEACLLLRRNKYLDSHLLPTYQKQLPAMRNAQLALTLKNTQAYDMRTKPAVWANSVGTVPASLYMTVIDLEMYDERRPGQPLALLTRNPLPEIPGFPLHIRAGCKSQVICTPMKRPLPTDPERLDAINVFTLRIFKDIFNKTYEVDVTTMPYFLAPVIRGSRAPRDGHAEDLLDWDVLKYVQDNDTVPWDENTPDEFFKDRFLVDPFDGGRRYFTIGVDPNLRPLDPVPPGAPTRRHMENILQYSSSLFKNSRARVNYKAEQPVILTRRVLHRRNWLDDISKEEESASSECYVCPEPLYVSALPTTIAAMALMFPAIMFRIDSVLIALELFENLNLYVVPELALEAVTKDSDNTEEHRAEQVHFQRGMGKNYERLELLGDAFLKMATSISLFTTKADSDEFEHHVNRMLLLCNKNLLKTAQKLRLFEWIRSKSFSRRVWYPEEPKLLQGKGINRFKQEHKHPLNDKTMADVCEAIIGAALLSPLPQDGAHYFDNAVAAVTAVVDSPNHAMMAWPEYFSLYKTPGYQTAPPTRSQIDLADQIAHRHGYRFRHPRLLRSAFLHPSYPFSWEKVPCYQRLEFLGDSLLDMVCVGFLFHRFPDRDPQWLTEHKMAMVSNKFLGALCVQLGFHKHLRSNGSTLEAQIREYVMDIQETEREADGAVDYWVHAKSPPKALPDIVESYIGAVFVDSEYDYGEVERFFERHVKPFFENMSIYDTYANNHPTTFLTNLLTLSFHCTNFRILSQEIPALNPSSVSSSSPAVLAAVMIHNDVVAEGQAASGKTAKVKASSNALRKLQNLSEVEFRKTYRCDCTGEAIAAAGVGREAIGGGAPAAPADVGREAIGGGAPAAPAGVGREAIGDGDSRGGAGRDRQII